METSSPADPASTSIFAVPCPGCAAELVPLGSSTYRCPQCGGRYRASLGYLVPVEGTSSEAS